MSRNTTSFALPEPLGDHIDERVQSGQFGNTSEHLRDLIWRDREEQVLKQLDLRLWLRGPSWWPAPLMARRALS